MIVGFGHASLVVKRRLKTIRRNGPASRLLLVLLPFLFIEWWIVLPAFVSQAVGWKPRPSCVAVKAGLGSPAVQLGHDGSEAAAAFLQQLEQRQLLGNAQLLSPKGVPSQGNPGAAVWAVVPGLGGATSVPLGDWALYAPAIGTSGEWDFWDHLQGILGNRWWGAYAWEYWRFFRAPPLGEGTASAKIRELQDAAKSEGWWKSPESGVKLASMLKEHGFVVLDNFLPASMAKQLADTARTAQKQMSAGVLSTGANWARGDSVLWVNTHDPASSGFGNIVPQEGQSSASIPELSDVLANIDALVADVLAPQFPDRMQCIRTRSHAMFTCYPGTETQVLDAAGQAWAGPCASSSAKGYLRHLDNERLKGHCGRILTTILYLNPEWRDADGGSIRLFEVDPPLQVRGELLPLGNRLLAFWADEVPHEVLPPFKDRFACTFWYLDRDVDPSSVGFEKAPATQAAAAAGSVFLD